MFCHVASASVAVKVKIAKNDHVLQDLYSESSMLQACSTVPYVMGSMLCKRSVFEMVFMQSLFLGDVVYCFMQVSLGVLNQLALDFVRFIVPLVCLPSPTGWARILKPSVAAQHHLRSSGHLAHCPLAAPWP